MATSSSIAALRRSLLGLIVALLIPVSVFAADTSGAFYSITVTFFNIAISTTEIQAPFPISGSALINGSFMEPDALNTVLQAGSLDQPSMPASDRTRMLVAAQDDGGTFNDLTAEANDGTFADVPLLPSTPANDDAFYFVGDNPFRILTLNIGQEAVYSVTGTFVYEYFNGQGATGYATASNVDDRTNEFTVFGVNTISFDAPTDWIKNDCCGFGTQGYTFRVRLQDAPTQTQQPLATQIWYETGLWWTWIDQMDPDEQTSFVLFLGGPDIIDHHQIFLGDEGIVTLDAAGLELGNTYGIQINTRLTPFTVGACVVCKGDVLRLYVSDVGELTLDVSGSSEAESLVISGITAPVTGTQIVGIDSDGTTLSLSVTGESTVSGTAVDIVDVADDYVWSTTGATAYLEYIALSTTGVFGQLESWDTLGEWNLGVLVDTESQAGQPDFAQNYIPEQNEDDGMWWLPSNFGNTNADARFGFDSLGVGDSVSSFFRFTDISIPQGSTITSAIIRLDPSQTLSGSTVSVTVSGVAQDNPTTIIGFTDAQTRARTTAAVTWSPVPTFTFGTKADTPDLTNILQELVDRPGWNSGNAIILLIEDNSSSAHRSVSTRDGIGSAAQLIVTYDQGLSLPNDFIQRESVGTVNGDDVPGWALSCGGCRDAKVEASDRQRSGLRVLNLDEGNSVGTAGAANQVISNVNPAEVWSFRFTAIKTSANDDVARFIVSFRDSVGGVLATSTNTVPVLSSGTQVRTLSGLTAPANTADILITIENRCDQSPFTCTSGGTEFRVDSIVGCICNPAPNFPDASNRVTNPSFEEARDRIGTWTSQTVVPPINNSQSTGVFWTSQLIDGFTSSEESLVVSVSTTSGAPFQVVANNGDPIPGINPGDDLSQLGIQLRFTLQATGAAPTVDATPMVSEALLAFIGAANEFNSSMFYELRTTPSFEIADLTGNGFDGDLNLPVAPLLPVALVSSLQALDVPAVAQDQGASTADFVANVEEPDNFLGPGGFGDNLPLAPLFDLVVARTGVPDQIFMILFAMVVTIYAGVAMYYSFQSITAAFTAMLISLIGFTFIDQGVIPWWVVFVYAFMGGFWVWSDRSAP